LKFLNLLFLAVLCSSSLEGQSIMDFNKDKEYPQKMPVLLKTSPISMISGPVPFLTAEYALIYEVPVDYKQSMQIGLSILGKGLVLRALENSLSQGYNQVSFHVAGIKFQYTYKFFLRNRGRFAPAGRYVGTLFNFATGGIGQTYQYLLKDDYYKFTNYNINLIYGRQLMRKSARGLVLECYGGIGYKKNILDVHYASARIVPVDLSGIPFYSSSLNITLGVNVGWAFCHRQDY
jgi:hypothetical protein